MRSVCTEPTRSREFASFDELAAAISDADVRILLLAREQRPWTLAARVVGGTLVQHGTDGGAHAASGAVAPERVALYLSGDPASARVCNGELVDQNCAYFLAAGSPLHIEVRRPGEWYALSMDPALLAAAAAAAGAGPLRHGLLGPAPEQVGALRSLVHDVAEGSHLSEDLESALVRAAVRVLTCGTPLSPRARRPRIDRHRLLTRVDEVLRETRYQPVSVPSLCKRLGIPERTLRHLFEELYGACPVHVLRSRRLCEVRDALLGASAGERVRDIATRHGFTHLGQFAADYRRLFGVLPSKSLRRPGRARTWTRSTDSPGELAGASAD